MALLALVLVAACPFSKRTELFRYDNINGIKFWPQLIGIDFTNFFLIWSSGR